MISLFFVVLLVQFDPVTSTVVEGATVSLRTVLSVAASSDVTVDLTAQPLVQNIYLDFNVRFSIII